MQGFCHFNHVSALDAVVHVATAFAFAQDKFPVSQCLTRILAALFAESQIELCVLCFQRCDGFVGYTTFECFGQGGVFVYILNAPCQPHDVAKQLILDGRFFGNERSTILRGFFLGTESNLAVNVFVLTNSFVLKRFAGLLQSIEDVRC